jgi:hypothetical protein
MSKYTPPAVVTADLDVADAPYLGGEFGVYMTDVAAVKIGECQLTAAGVGTYVSHLAASIKTGGADLQVVVAPGKKLTSSILPIVAFAGTDDADAAATCIAALVPPSRAKNQRYNFQAGWAADLTVSTGSTKKMKTITGMGAMSTIATVEVAVGGTGYVVGDVLTISGGTLAVAGTAAATVKVLTVTSGAVTTVQVVHPGAYTAAPSASAAASTGGTGTGATFNLTFSTTGIVGGGANQVLELYQLPELTDYTFIIATTDIDFGIKTQQAKGINAGLVTDQWVKGGMSAAGELNIGSKYQTLADGMARFAGQKNTCMLVGVKEQQLIGERLVFTQYWPSIKPKVPSEDNESTMESAGKFVGHAFFVAP